MTDTSHDPMLDRYLADVARRLGHLPRSQRDDVLAGLREHIAELRDYARFHFACEEALMRVFNFADITLHAAEHAHFLKFLSEMENSSLRKSMENDLVRQLRSWVTKHIVGSDRDFSRHVLSGAAIDILTT